MVVLEHWQIGHMFIALFCYVLYFIQKISIFCSKGALYRDMGHKKIMEVNNRPYSLV